ncbi:MAG: PAS domain S-box protein [Elusimicrobia bacterium]|nr:PAS domain S-box protein [Elusimicrobiota bacterium]
MPEASPSPFERQSLEALKGLGKALGQMSLYKVGHPAVAETLKAVLAELSAVLEQTSEGELAYSLDQDKLIANGRIAGLLSRLPSAIPAFFTRFKIGSLTLKRGLEYQELVALCELSAARQDLGQPGQAFLDAKGASHILLNEAVYTKLKAVDLNEALQNKSAESTIQALIQKAVPNAAQHGELYEKVMHLLQDDVERRVEEVVSPIRKEKSRLENEQARTMSVLQNVAEGVVMVDDQGRVLMMNPAAEQIYGASLAQLAGKPLSEAVGENHVTALAAEIATPTDRPIKPEVKVLADEETRRVVKAAGAMVQNEAGKVVGMVSALTDSVKHKEFQSLQRDFVAHVTHELRAPLSSIRAALEILQDEVSAKIEQKDNQVLGTAIRNSERLSGLIDSILDFSKIESGQMTVYPKRASAESLAREAVESLTPWAKKQGLALTLSLGQALPLVAADAKRTVQVLVNLISNAIKFTPAGGRITVSANWPKALGKASLGEKQLLFSVVDTGCGIAKDDQDRIFEKFVQIASGELHVGGTGLGLAIAKALVHMQEGKMWVESESGKGSTFYFTLPVHHEPAEPALRKPAPRSLWQRILGLFQ